MRLHHLIAVMVFLLLNLNCNSNSKLFSTGKTFFTQIDNGKYDLAFNLLSDEDKQFSNQQDFSLKIQHLIESKYYPSNLDSNASYSISAIPDSIMVKINSKTPLPKDAHNICLCREIRRIPDIVTISKSIDEADIFEKDKKLMKIIIGGKFPTVLDSSRFVMVMLISGKPFVYTGARYWKARDTLLTFYENYIKSNLSISSIGNGAIYRSNSYNVYGSVEFKLKNNSRDILNTASIKVKAIFNGINTEPTYITSDPHVIPPKSEIASEAFFTDGFIHDLLGYSTDYISIKPGAEIASFPTRGKGPDYDSIMSLKQNSFFEDFCMPVKSGISKLFIGI